MVRQALANAPPERKPVHRERPAIGPVQSFIDRILEADRSAPRKQRQYCASIYERIRSELPEHKVAEVAVRVYVRQRKHKLGWTTRETCVPQSYAPGREGQVDWCEAWAVLQVNRSSCKFFRAQHGERRSLPSGLSSRPSRRFSKLTSRRFIILAASSGWCVR